MKKNVPRSSSCSCGVRGARRRGPAGLPAAVTQRLQAALAESLKAPDLVQRLTSSGATIAAAGAPLADFQAAEIEKYRRIVQQANIRL